MTTCSHCEHANPAGEVVCTGCGTFLPGSDSAFATLSGDTAGDCASHSTPFPAANREVASASNIGSTAATRSLRKSAPSAGEYVAASSAMTAPGAIRASDYGIPTRTSTSKYDSGAHNPVAVSTAEPPVVAQPRLVVVRGERVNVAYAILEGKNYVGRSADKPVDIDLDGQEAVERIWTSRQHAVIIFDRGRLTIEDLNSLNGTFVNRTRLNPGTAKPLAPGDVLQFGTVQLKVFV